MATPEQVVLSFLKAQADSLNLLHAKCAVILSQWVQGRWTELRSDWGSDTTPGIVSQCSALCRAMEIVIQRCLVILSIVSSAASLQAWLRCVQKDCSGLELAGLEVQHE